MSISAWIESMLERSVGERPRALSVIGSRAYIETNLPAHADMARFAELVTARAEEEEWIDQAFVEPFTRRIVLHVRGPMPANDLLAAFAEGVERALDPVRELGLPPRERRLPDDDALEHEQLIEVIADALAVFFGSTLRWVPFVPRGLGQNIHALLFVIAESDRLRAPLDRGLGRERAEFVLHLARAAAQGVAQRPLSALVELSAKAFGLRELRARRALWQRWAPELTEVETRSPISELPPRPRPVPNGPVEKYSERALTMALGSFGFSLLTTRSPARAIASGFAALPRPVQLGRELYCAELGRELAKQGTLVLSSQALRRLDRVDCLVIPARLVAREQFVVGDVHGLSGISRERALELAKELFVPARPLRVQQHGAYTLGPVRLLSQPLAPELESMRAERADRGALVLALSRGDQVAALVEVQISAQAGVVELLNVARRASLHIVLATDDLEAAEGLHPDDIVPLTRGLEVGIRRLQAEGRTVMLVGRGHLPAFASADVGVGLFVRGEPAPWGAHLICPDDTRALETVIEACVAARKVSEQSARLGIGTLAFGTLAAAGARTSPALARVFFVLNAGSLATMLNAVRNGSEVTHHARKVTDPTPWHALEIEGVLARLGTTRDGLVLPAGEAAPHHEEPNKSAWLELARAVRAELMNPLSPLLALGAGISAMVGSMADAGIVAGVGGINAMVGGYQRFRTERAIDHLVERAETRVHVKRDGKIQSVATSSLLRGDILLLSQGDFVPADCRILDSESLEVDTSTLTGESLPVLKNATPSFAETFPDITSMVYEGATIAAGRATVVVVATGEDTALRRGAAATPDETRGGVEGRLRELMRLTGPVAAGAGALLVVAGFLRGRHVDDLVSTGVGLAVAAVPEGLPLLATAAQLSAAERLSRGGSLVKNPRAIEALGRVDVLCVDKTGTLTEGHIELALISDSTVSAAVSEASPELRRVLRVAAHAVGRDRGLTFDPMDRAILAAADGHGLNEPMQMERLAERAFESGRGFQASLGRAEDGILMYVKGAPEQLIERATHARLDGSELSIRSARTRLHAELRRLGQDGLRIIAVAERRFAADAFDPAAPTALLSDPHELCLLGFLAFRDPTRATAARAVAGLARAGVRVIMLTGDHASTAESVAREVGLLEDHTVVTGAEVAQLDEAALEHVARRKSVFARVTPAQKVRIVRALQRTGHVVGMVGDGANDAPAMRISDVGIAVGAHCTEAARGAADIVLADARIDALVGAVIEGRAMWSSVRDAVSILVGGNLGEIAFTIGVGGLTGSPPLHPRQLLLVNFLTDIAPSMAIALRPPKQTELDELEALGPGGALGAPLNRDILSRAICTAFGAGTAWTVGRLTGSSARARTIGLVGLVGSQLGQTLRAGNNSKAVRYTSFGSLAALALIIQTPGLSHIFGCKPLGPIAWSTALSASALATLISPAVDATVSRAADLVARFHTPAAAAPAVEVVLTERQVEPHERLEPALRLLRN